MRGLKGKTAIITGAASQKGIGFASASRLADEGARVVLTDLNEEGVRQRAEELCSRGAQAVGLEHDATNEGSWKEVLARSKAEFGVLDILVNNAGIVFLGHALATSLADWKRVLDVNGSMAFLGCKLAAREMLASGRSGAIVNVSSTAAIVAGEQAAAYCASKSAVQMMTKVMALEMAKHGIRVNSVNPGYTMTEMFTGSLSDPESEVAQTIAMIPTSRLANPAEIASAVAFLASDEASYCNGTALVVDGGLTL